MKDELMSHICPPDRRASCLVSSLTYKHFFGLGKVKVKVLWVSFEKTVEEKDVFCHHIPKSQRVNYSSPHAFVLTIVAAGYNMILR